MQKCFHVFLCSSIICFLLSSCKVNQKVPYFQDFADTSKPALIKTTAFVNPAIQPDDVLSITIETLDNTVTTAVEAGNNSGSGGSSGTTTATPIGYLVNKNGMVDLPFVGKIKLSGLTTAEAQDTVYTAANKYFNNPIVNVRFANFKITVLGEVARPSSFIMPNEKVTIFDALGMAGDLTLYGRRENVLLLRDTANDNRQMVRLNLNSKNIVSSPYFYLKPNDVIYVEPNKSRIQSTNAQRSQIFAIVGISISVITLVLTRLKL